MYKKIALVIIIAFIGVLAFYFFNSPQPQEPVKITPEFMAEKMKNVIGIDFNIMPLRAVWNNGTEEITLTGKGYYYTDKKESIELDKQFGIFDDLFTKEGFLGDEFNPKMDEGGEKLNKYKKDNLVCNLSIIDNENNTSSLAAVCADIDAITYSFGSGKGVDCNTDSDCELIFDGCQSARVCRNKNYIFYNDCDNPSQLVKDIDFSTAGCKCVENQCIPIKAGQQEE